MNQPSLCILDAQNLDQLTRMVLKAPSAFVLWGAARRPAGLALALLGAQHRVRTYLLGPADLGTSLTERADLKRHATRLLARRAVSVAADLVIAGRGQDGALLLHDQDSSYSLRLSPSQAQAAFGWFCHLFWHHAAEEGWASATGYRFHRPGQPLFQAPAPADEASLSLIPGRPHLSARAAPVRLLSGDGWELHLDEGLGCLDVVAAGVEMWSLRLRLR